MFIDELNRNLKKLNNSNWGNVLNSSKIGLEGSKVDVEEFRKTRIGFETAEETSKENTKQTNLAENNTKFVKVKTTEDTFSLVENNAKPINSSLLGKSDNVNISQEIHNNNSNFDKLPKDIDPRLTHSIDWLFLGNNEMEICKKEVLNEYIKIIDKLDKELGESELQRNYLLNERTMILEEKERIKVETKTLFEENLKLEKNLLQYMNLSEYRLTENNIFKMEIQKLKNKLEKMESQNDKLKGVKIEEYEKHIGELENSLKKIVGERDYFLRAKTIEEHSNVNNEEFQQMQRCMISTQESKIAKLQNEVNFLKIKSGTMREENWDLKSKVKDINERMEAVQKSCALEIQETILSCQAKIANFQTRYVSFKSNESQCSDPYDQVCKFTELFALEFCLDSNKNDGGIESRPDNCSENLRTKKSELEHEFKESGEFEIYNFEKNLNRVSAKTVFSEFLTANNNANPGIESNKKESFFIPNKLTLSLESQKRSGSQKFRMSQDNKYSGNRELLSEQSSSTNKDSLEKKDNQVNIESSRTEFFNENARSSFHKSMQSNFTDFVNETRSSKTSISNSYNSGYSISQVMTFSFNKMKKPSIESGFLNGMNNFSFKKSQNPNEQNTSSLDSKKKGINLPKNKSEKRTSNDQKFQTDFDEENNQNRTKKVADGNFQTELKNESKENWKKLSMDENCQTEFNHENEQVLSKLSVEKDCQTHYSIFQNRNCINFSFDQNCQTESIDEHMISPKNSIAKNTQTDFGDEKRQKTSINQICQTDFNQSTIGDENRLNFANIFMKKRDQSIFSENLSECSETEKNTFDKNYHNESNDLGSEYPMVNKNLSETIHKTSTYEEPEFSISNQKISFNQHCQTTFSRPVENFKAPAKSSFDQQCQTVFTNQIEPESQAQSCHFDKIIHRESRESVFTEFVNMSIPPAPQIRFDFLRKPQSTRNIQTSENELYVI